MRRVTGRWTDAQVEQIVGNLLRAGVLIAASVVLLGGVLYLIRYGSTLPNYRVFHGEPKALRDLSEIVPEAVSLHRNDVIQLGLLLLIATPILRVAFSIFAFLKQRDYVYVFVTLIVLGVLLYSLIGTQ
jgi:uncharacterized membrane protein